MAKIDSAKAVYFRNFVFGVEDSLVSTVGLLSGIASANVSRETIALTGIVLIFVEAFSMAVGSFLSERSVEELESHRSMLTKRSWAGGLVMFFSYFVAGFIPLSPYFVLSSEYALWASIVLSLLALYTLGLLEGKLAHIRAYRGAFEIMLLGGCAILIGVFVGRFLGGRGI